MFKLDDYTKEIQSIAKSNNCSNVEALDKFITNLIIMREHYTGAPGVFYNTLGQQWNSFSSVEKVRQKEVMVEKLSRTRESGRS